jgi:phosphoribosylformylglycinamidine (FGAM) synthase-like amidotransferase family enzyme
MPHPERALFGMHHPDWTRTSRKTGAPSDDGPGAALFANACNWVKKNR